MKLRFMNSLNKVPSFLSLLFFVSLFVFHVAISKEEGIKGNIQPSSQKSYSNKYVF